MNILKDFLNDMGLVKNKKILLDNENPSSDTWVSYFNRGEN